MAGATNETLLELALRSDLITGLKVDESGKVVDLDKAVEQLKRDIPNTFTQAGAGGPTRERARIRAHRATPRTSSRRSRRTTRSTDRRRHTPPARPPECE